MFCTFSQLANGLDVATIPCNDATSTTALIRIRDGWVHDPTNFPGLAHVLEHMAVLGVKKELAPDCVITEAATGLDGTRIWIRFDQSQEMGDMVSRLLRLLFSLEWVDVTCSRTVELDIRREEKTVPPPKKEDWRPRVLQQPSLLVANEKFDMGVLRQAAAARYRPERAALLVCPANTFNMEEIHAAQALWGSVTCPFTPTLKQPCSTLGDSLISSLRMGNIPETLTTYEVNTCIIGCEVLCYSDASSLSRFLSAGLEKWLREICRPTIRRPGIWVRNEMKISKTEHYLTAQISCDPTTGYDLSTVLHQLQQPVPYTHVFTNEDRRPMQARADAPKEVCERLLNEYANKHATHCVEGEACWCAEPHQLPIEGLSATYFVRRIHHILPPAPASPRDPTPKQLGSLQRSSTSPMGDNSVTGGQNRIAHRRKYIRQRSLPGSPNRLRLHNKPVHGPASIKKRPWRVERRWNCAFPEQKHLQAASDLLPRFCKDYMYRHRYGWKVTCHASSGRLVVCVVVDSHKEALAGAPNVNGSVQCWLDELIGVIMRVKPSAYQRLLERSALDLPLDVLQRAVCSFSEVL